MSEELRVKSETLDLWSLATEGTQEFATAPVYDLQGRRVTQPTKGLFIVRSAEGRLQGKNGKKVVIK